MELKEQISIGTVLESELRVLQNTARMQLVSYQQLTESGGDCSALFAKRLPMILAELERLDRTVERVKGKRTMEPAEKSFRILLRALEEHVRRSAGTAAILSTLQKIEFIGIASYRALGEICESLGQYRLGEMLDLSQADKENFCHEIMEQLRHTKEKKIAPAFEHAVN